MKIWNVPIESLEERYSADWNHWFPKVFEENNVEYETVYGDELTNKIEQGAFLDVIGTNYFKASQIQKLCKLLYDGKIKDGDIIFFHDLWFPGIESLAYIRDALNLKFKIVGILHAGTWDNQDFLSKKGMTKWASYLEESWFNFIDTIFVATEFHKNLILQERNVKCLIYVTGLPIYPREDLNPTKKEKIIIFPHRLDSEKQPEEFDKLEKIFREEYPELSDWKFIKTKEAVRDFVPNGVGPKEVYFHLLKKATFAISTALQETWGIAMQEALFCYCIPFVPDRLSYSEMYDEEFRYKGIIELAENLRNIIKSKENIVDLIVQNRKELIYKGKQAIPNMIRIMKEM